MSFVTQKVLVCGICEKIVAIEEDKFPEDLHALLSKYCLPQLYWICKSCEKQSIFKSSFEKKSNLESEVESLKSKVESLQLEVIAIKKIITLDAKKNCDSSVANISVLSVASSPEVDYPSKNEDSSLNFRNYKTLYGNLSNTEDSLIFHSSPAPESSVHQNQSMDSNGPLVTANDQKSSGSDEASPKRKKEAHALIHHISNSKIKIDDKESTKSSNVVDVFLKCITPFLKKDTVFNHLYSRDYRTGSSYNDLRISAASEYDVDIVFKAPSEINLEVEFFKEISAYAKIKFQKVGDTSPNKLDVLKFFEKNSLDGYLQPLKISAWFQGLVDLFLLSNPEITGIKKIKNRQSGPARTIEIVTDEGYILHIDLVPVFVFSYDILEKTKIKEIIKKYPVDQCKTFWFLVPKQCQGEGQLLASDCKLSWRVDFPEVEKKVLHNKQSAKHVIRLLKLLRDRERLNIASYYIKTLILWRVHKNPEATYWQGQVLFERYLETLKFMQECVKNQSLPFFMDPSYNLFHALNKDECKNLSNRLQRIVSSIEADHNNLNNFYS